MNLFRKIPSSDNNKELNNKNKISSLLIVFLTLLTFFYFFSSIPALLGHKLILGENWDLFSIFANFNLRYNFPISPFGTIFNQLSVLKNEISIFIFCILGCFFTTYYLPVKLKRLSLILWYMVAAILIFEIKFIFFIAGSFSLVYLTFHYSNKYSIYIAPLALPLIYGRANFFVIPLCFISLLLFKFFMQKKIYTRHFFPHLRFLLLNIPFLYVYASQLYFNIDLYSNLSLFVFLLYWYRIIHYYIDFKDGFVEHDLCPVKFFSIFLNLPSMIIFVSYVGQGYLYLESVFLEKDKNKILYAGIRLYATALLYFLCFPFLLKYFILFLENYGIEIFAYEPHQLIKMFSTGTRVGIPSVIFTFQIYVLDFIVLFGGLQHFKVATWKIFGYDVHPQFNFPLLATNLVEFWNRYIYHYREFLFRVFYLPIYFYFKKSRPIIRLFLATFGAVGVGHFFVSTYTYFFYKIKNSQNLFLNWPHCTFLALGIFLTLAYKVKKNRKRNPWSFDRFIFIDIICSILTFHYFSMVQLFNFFVPDANFWNYFKLFLLGYGIRI